MVEILDANLVEQEFQGISKVNDIEAGAHQAPLNNLTDTQFELLLWSVFKQQIKSKEYYDKATLMIAGADRGRDVWLTKDGNPAGLIQCKRLKSAFSAPGAVREIIKFILFAELDPALLYEDLPFKYSLAVSTDPASTTVDVFTSPTAWFQENDDRILSYVNDVISAYKSFQNFSGTEKLARVKSRLKLFSYELIRPSDIDVLLNDFPRVRERFFHVRLVQSEEAFVDLFDRKVEEHGLGHHLSEKTRLLLDAEVQTEIDRLRRSRFFPGSDINKSALTMRKRLMNGDLRQASDQARSNALGACARWLSRSEEKAVAHEAIEASEKLGTSEEADIAKAFLLGDEDWSEGLKALSPLDSPTRVTAALQTVKNGSDAKQALKWFEDAGFVANDLDTDGKAVLLICRLENRDWGAAHTLATSLTEENLIAAPVLFYFSGMARLLSVVPEDLRDFIRSNMPLTLKQFPLADDLTSLAERRAAVSLFRRAEQAAAEFNLDAQHTYGSFAHWLELRDPDDHEDALKRLTMTLSQQDKAIHYIPLGMSFDLTIDRRKVEQVVSRQEALRPGGNFEIAFARFILANSTEDPVKALEYLELHRDLFKKHINAEAILEFEVQAGVLAGRNEWAKEILEKASQTLSEFNKARIEKIISQGSKGPGLDDLEVSYRENPTTANLVNLVNWLGQQGFSDRFFELARKLIVETRSKSETERVVGLLLANGRHEEIETVLSDASALVGTSHELRGAKVWVQFRNGDFDEALRAVIELKKERSEPNDRYLHQNLLISSGRWEELTAFVEEEWQNREERSPNELHALAQLSGAIGSPRLTEFLRAAARSGEDNPDILLGCYLTASESGIEEGTEVLGWFERAAQLSGEDGPVQTMSIDDMVQRQPDLNEHVDTVWESYRKGEMPFSMVAAQLRRSSLEMQVSSIVLNHKQADPRKRSIASAFSGVRGTVTVDLKKLGLESTALVTLASLNILDEVMQQYDAIHIPHSTLGWLFSERRKLAFHQPSRIKAARTLINALTTGKVHEYSASMAPDAELATLVDIELAEMLTSARTDDGVTQTLVIRSAPVHRIGSLMDETVDLSGFQSCLGSCQTVVDKLTELGLLMPEDEKQARTFLSRIEQRWPAEPQIEDGAQLYLDGLSVSYFQTTNLLRLLADAGFEVFVPKSKIREASALLEISENAEDFEQIIERMRKTLSEGISSGKICVDRIFSEDDLKEHPNIAVLQLAGKVDGVVSDDRGLNQYQHIGENSSHTPIFTSLDLLADLAQKGIITEVKIAHYRTFLRKAGYVLFPMSQEELLLNLEKAKVKNSTLIETAYLKAFRENLLLTQMRGWLVLTKEIAWFDKLKNDLISVLVAQWKPEIQDDEARARSRWILQFLDIRNWAGSIVENDGSGLAQYGLGIMCNSLALRHLHIQDGNAADRYSDWLRDEVFDVLRTSDPFVYNWLIKLLQEMLISRLEVGGESDD